MNFIKSAIFGGSKTQAAASNEESKQEDQQTKQPATEQDLLNQFMPEEMQEEMFCFTMGDCELHKIVPRHDRQIKECEYMRASVHITSMAITDDDSGASYAIPIVVLDNDDYDESQD